MNPIHPRLIAFYLPQFHPIPENNEWWGRGFTEWTNVAKAKPLFRGHYQPHLPSELGFYDLRLAEVRQAQADLASEYGIYGFCYYHYWFNGARLLERPFTEVLRTKKPEFPFCLCWANENWTRTWDGKETNILLSQEYSEQDNINHLKYLTSIFHDYRYIRYKGKPIFLVYKPNDIPNPKIFTELWREQYYKMSKEDLFLVRVERSALDGGNPRDNGFDAAMEFQPDWELFHKPLRKGKYWRLLTGFGLSSKAYLRNTIMPYQDLVGRALKKPKPSYLRFPSVTPGWDNSPRKNAKAIILIKSTPELYEYWLTSVMKKHCTNSSECEFVFINAWNEWGEGNHLEPDVRYGRGYLEATRNALDTFQQ